MRIFTTASIVLVMMITNAVVVCASPMSSGTMLDLKQAELLAIEHDAMLKMKRSQSEAFLEESVSADTLPDPRLRLGLMNYPTDTFSRSQEPMTQNVIGFQQMIPRGDVLQINSHKARASSELADAEAFERQRKVVLQVRNVYLELLYWIHAERTVNQSKNLFRKLVQITESQYASGVQRQQDVFRAELEFDMLDDRLDDIMTKQDLNRAKLVKLVGEQAGMRALEPEFPELGNITNPDDESEQLKNHPRITVAEARVKRSRYGIELAKQSYKPGWMFELSYGFRDGTNPDGSSRPDFASAMVSFDIPLFTGDRQDRQVAASRLNYQASIDGREEVARELYSEYQQALSTWLRHKTRLARYRSDIVPQAKNNASAALLAYQSHRGDFTTLMRARITELETSLKSFRLHTNLLKSQAILLYLLGEEK